MKLHYLLLRTIKFAFNRRKEIFDRELWGTIGRILRTRLNFWEKVSKKEFIHNLDIMKQRPWNIHVELTNHCNSNCIFCAYQYQSRPISIMSDEVFTKVLDEYCAIGGGDLLLQGVVGDPAIDPKFIKRIQQARKRKEIDKIKTITNAIALIPGEINQLINSGLSELSISTGPLEETLYKKIFRNESYEKVLHVIGALLKANKTAECPVDIKLCFRSNMSMKETVRLPDYLKIASYGHHSVEFNTDFDTWTGEITEKDLLPGMNLRPQSKIAKEPCIWLYDGPVIFADGKIGLCGSRDFNADSELIVGNIKENSLMDTWCSEKVVKLRESYYSAHPPEICAKCTTYASLNLFRTKPGLKRALLTQNRMINSGIYKN